MKGCFPSNVRSAIHNCAVSGASSTPTPAGVVDIGPLWVEAGPNLIEPSPDLIEPTSNSVNADPFAADAGATLAKPSNGTSKTFRCPGVCPRAVCSAGALCGQRAPRSQKRWRFELAPENELSGLGSAPDLVIRPNFGVVVGPLAASTWDHLS